MSKPYTINIDKRVSRSCLLHIGRKRMIELQDLIGYYKTINNQELYTKYHTHYIAVVGYFHIIRKYK